MKQQQGAALVIVMALLAGALMLGMSVMQSALIDERLAGNYRASVQSQMSGEAFLSGLISDQSSDTLDRIIHQVMESGREGNIPIDDVQLLTLLDELSVDIEVTRRDSEITIEAWGTQAGAKSSSSLIFNVSGSAANLRSPFLACQRIQLTGSSLAASCRSNAGVCSQSPTSFISSESHRYNLLFNVGSEQGNGITLEGDTHVYGNVRSQRDIQLAGSSVVKGNAYALGAIFHGGGTAVLGEEVLAQSSPQRCNGYLDLVGLHERRSAYIHQYGNSAGDVSIGAYPSSQWALTPEGLFYYDERQAPRDCGFLGLGCLFSDILNRVFNLLGFDACGSAAITCERNQVGWVKHSSVINNTVVVNNLRLDQNPTLVVAGLQSNQQNNPAPLRIVVEGEFSVGGGGAGLLIENNAQLALFVKGQTFLNANFQMGNDVGARAGQPPLTINSSYSGSGYAVTLASNSHLVGNIYAPEGAVLLNSSRVTGSIWARELHAFSNSQMIFNEANAVADGQAIETEAEGGSGFNWQWK